MAESYKYRLHELFGKLPNQDFRKSKEFICNEMGVSPRTLENWIYAKNTDKGILIPGQHLVKLANFFQLTTEELFTEKLETDLREKFYELHSTPKK